MIRNTERSDARAIMSIVGQSGQFDEESLAHIEQTLENHLMGHSDAIWLTADDGEPVGVAYCAPEPVASGVWNLLMLWTRSDRYGQGHGTALVSEMESQLRERTARLLIVETSGLPAFAPARAFYEKCGFKHEAIIKNYFAHGDDKLVFTKPLMPENG
jgi:ribosomal protein S18 acetylase RimI-like enzyme